jgi:hypothetical protein
VSAVTDIPCPECGAGVGDWCRDVDGRTRPGPTLVHPARHRGQVRPAPMDEAERAEFLAWAAWAEARGLIELADGSVARLVCYRRFGKHRIQQGGRHRDIERAELVRFIPATAVAE